MARVTTITVGIETSIKIKEYQYYKPRIDITYELGNNETPGEVMAHARDRLHKEIDKLNKEFEPKKNSEEVPF